MAPCGRLRGPVISKWKEAKAEKNRRSLVRLNKALPSIFPSAVLSRALGRPFIPPTPRLAIDSYWGAHPLRADRPARALAARSGAPSGWSWRLGDNRKNGLPATFRYRPRPTGNTHMRLAPAFAVCAGNPFIASAGTSIYGRPGPTRMQSGTAPAWLHGNSGVRLVITRDFCGACKHGAAANPVDGCGRRLKSIIAPRCLGYGANTGMSRGRSCSITGAYRTFR